jgi:hypothetical protein
VLSTAAGIQPQEGLATPNWVRDLVQVLPGPVVTGRLGAYPQVAFVTWLGGTVMVVAIEPPGSSTV